MAVIPGISALKKRTRAGLLSVASLLPSGTDWRRGVDYVPEGCTAPDAVPVCADDIDKPDAVVQAVVHFEPFGVVASDGCNDPWAMTSEFFDRASRVLDMGQSAILARELLQSTVTTNPDLCSTAVDVSPGGLPVGWVEAVTALLYNMMNAGYVGDVVIHAPNWLLPSFLASHVGWVDTATRRAYIGAHEVVFDAGYNGLIGPGCVAGGAAPNIAGWVYATGPIEYAFGALLDDDVSTGGDNRKNDRYVVAERPGIVRFDPCQVFAVLVSVCPCPLPPAPPEDMIIFSGSSGAPDTLSLVGDFLLDDVDGPVYLYRLIYNAGASFIDIHMSGPLMVGNPPGLVVSGSTDDGITFMAPILGGKTFNAVFITDFLSTSGGQFDITPVVVAP